MFEGCIVSDRLKTLANNAKIRSSLKFLLIYGIINIKQKKNSCIYLWNIFLGMYKY